MFYSTKRLILSDTSIWFVVVVAGRVLLSAEGVGNAERERKRKPRGPVARSTGPLVLLKGMVGAVE